MYISIAIFIILGLLLVGLFVYGRLFSNSTKDGKNLSSNKQAAQKRISGGGAGNSSIGDTKELIDIDGFHDGFILTKSGELVAILEILPLSASTLTSPLAFNGAFAKVIHSLPDNAAIQVVQLPLPNDITPLSDRYALHAYDWGVKMQQTKDPKEEAKFSKYREIAMTIGADIVQKGGLSSRRASFLTITQNAAPVGMLTDSSLEKATRDLQSKLHDIVGLFANTNIAVQQLSPRWALELLWYVYNPDKGAQTALEQTINRQSQLSLSGQTDYKEITALTQAQAEEALDDPGAIASVLAPATLEEDTEWLRIGKKRIVPYFAVDYRSQVPPIEAFMGPGKKFADRLLISYYITAPTADQVAHATRKSETVHKAVRELGRRAGQMGSFSQDHEIMAIEEARAGAELQVNVPRLLGLYAAIITEDDDEVAKADMDEFEAIMRAAGVVYVHARWTPLEVWRSMLPLGLRHHTQKTDRNVFADNVHTLNPLTLQPLFDPRGAFVGYTKAGHGTISPVAIHRARGEKLIPGDAYVGMQGSGKSFALKYSAYNWLSRGHRVLVVDPNQEFVELTKKVYGSAVDVMGGKGFNLFTFDYFPVDPQTDGGKDLRELIMSNNIAALEALYGQLKRGHVSGVENTFLSQALQAAMRSKRMDPFDTRTWKPNQVFLKDVYTELVVNLTHQDPPTVAAMAYTLKEYADEDGLYFDKFNSPTDLSMERDMVAFVFGLSQFSGDKILRGLAYHFAFRLAYERAVMAFILDKNTRPFHIIIDEASQVLVSAPLVSSVVNMMSQLAKYNVSVHLAFQDMAAIEAADNLLRVYSGGWIESTNTLRGTIPGYYLLKMSNSSAEKAAELLKLEPQEARSLTQNNPRAGQCTLVIQGMEQHIPLFLLVPENFKPEFETRAEDQKARIDQMFSTPAPMNEHG